MNDPQEADWALVEFMDEHKGIARSEHDAHAGLCDPGDPDAIAAMRRTGERMEQKNARRAAAVERIKALCWLAGCIIAGAVLLHLHASVY